MIPVNGEWCLKTKTYVLGVLIANEVLKVSGPLGGQN